ncbi:MAG: class I SAM-dependent methyltransferase [Ktedonobacteraceae bacterium]|nr:class I SAM-dependent methyltransferase [Ktedonobacteraceae bacterium]
MASTWQDEENLYVLDSESGAEMARLMDQDMLVTRSMEGILPEELDTSTIHTVLDIACGPGGWALATAFVHPEMSVVGIDISAIMIKYAQAQAHVRKLQNVHFYVADATKPLEFPDGHFDLVNARFMIGFMPPPLWPRLMQECRRITKPGGFLRLTECDDMGHTSSPAFEKLWLMCARSFQLAERSFSPIGRDFGITPKMASFLREVGYQKIQQKAYAIDFSAEAEAHLSMYHDWGAGLKLLQPFLIKMRVTSQKEADYLYEQALLEMQAEDFCGMWYVLSALGQLPKL